MKRISSFASKLMDSVNNSSLHKNINIVLPEKPVMPQMPEMKQWIVIRNLIPSILDNFEEKYIEECSPLNLALYSSSIPENKYNHSYDLIIFIFLVLYINQYVKHNHLKIVSKPNENANATPHYFDFIKCFISVILFIFTKNVDGVF